MRLLKELQTSTRWQLIALLLLTLLLHGVGLTQWKPDEAWFNGGDVDSIMRLNQVQQLYDTKDWFNHHLTRLQPPHGMDSHWSRPVDLLLALGAIPLIPAMPVHDALLLWGKWMSAFLFVIAIIGVVIAARGLKIAQHPAAQGASIPLMLGLMALSNPVCRAYFAPGYTDHHGVFCISAIGVLACLLHLTEEPEESRASKLAWIAGGFTGLGVWVGVEFLVFTALVSAFMGASWLMNKPWARYWLAYALGTATAAMAGWMLEYRPADLGIIHYDSITLPHVALLVMMAAGVTALDVMDRKLSDPLPRAAMLAALGAFGLAALDLWFPKFLQGPMVDVHPVIYRFMQQDITELQSLFDLKHPFGMLALLALPLVGLCGAVMGFLSTRRASWLLLCGVLVAYTALMFLQKRWIIYTLPAALLGQAMLVVYLSGHARVQALFQKHFSEGTRPLLVLSLLVMLLPYLFAILDAMTESKSEEDAAVEESYGKCQEAMRKVIAEDKIPYGKKGEPLLVMTDVNEGTKLLFFTRQNLLATNYHRNHPGLVQLHDILYASDGKWAKKRMQEAGVEIILLCSAKGKPPFPYERQELPAEGVSEEYPFFKELVKGKYPSWLKPIAAHEKRPELIYARVIVKK